MHNRNMQKDVRIVANPSSQGIYSRSIHVFTFFSKIVLYGVSYCHKILGNAKLLEYDDTWRALLEHYRGKGCVVKGNLFPSKALLQKLPPL